MKEIVIDKAEFLTSSGSNADCPRPDKPEFAFIGRSNVGKSSLINMLCNRKGLAKVSGTPGKTITINHFLINEKWYLVDLPGYGYAKRSKTLREKWEQSMTEYFTQRENLMTVFVLVDSRIPPQAVDMELINYLGENQVPLCVVYTKTDKNNRSGTIKNIAAIEKKLSESWEELPIRFTTSSTEKLGRNEMLSFIEKAGKTFKREY